MLMRRMLPASVCISLGRTMMEWYPYLGKFKHGCLKEVRMQVVVMMRVRCFS